MSDLILIAIIFCTGAVLYRFRRPILGALRRFDARNAARREEEFRARFDPYAHYKQTLRLAEDEIEQVSEIATPDPRTGVPLTRYVFLGTAYDTREEADGARRTAVIAMAREFYKDLDTIALKRRARRADGIMPPRP